MSSLTEENDQMNLASNTPSLPSGSRELTDAQLDEVAGGVFCSRSALYETFRQIAPLGQFFPAEPFTCTPTAM
jgi:hypothetical protein